MLKRILFPIDGSATSERGLDKVVKLAKRCNATVRLVHIADRISFTALVA